MSAVVCPTCERPVRRPRYPWLLPVETLEVGAFVGAIGATSLSGPLWACVAAVAVGTFLFAGPVGALWYATDLRRYTERKSAWPRVRARLGGLR